MKPLTILFLVLVLFVSIAEAQTTTTHHFTSEEIWPLAYTYQLGMDYSLGHVRWKQDPSVPPQAGLVCVVRNLRPYDRIDGYMIGIQKKNFRAFLGQDSYSYSEFIEPNPTVWSLTNSGSIWGRDDFFVICPEEFSAIGFGPRFDTTGFICEMSTLSLTVPDYATVEWMGGAVPALSSSFGQVKALFR